MQLKWEAQKGANGEVLSRAAEDWFIYYSLDWLIDLLSFIELVPTVLLIELPAQTVDKRQQDALD
jgi:hypothetical protein